MRVSSCLLATFSLVALTGCGVVRNVQTVPTETAWTRYHASVDEISPGMDEASLNEMFGDAVPGEANIGWIEPPHLPRELKWPGILRRMYVLGYYEPQLRGGYRDIPVTTVVVDNGVVTQVAVLE